MEFMATDQFLEKKIHHHYYHYFIPTPPVNIYLYLLKYIYIMLTFVGKQYFNIYLQYVCNIFH
jgi:hypothetical protein